MRQCNGFCMRERLPTFDHQSQTIEELQHTVLLRDVEIIRLRELINRLRNRTAT